MEKSKKRVYIISSYIISKKSKIKFALMTKGLMLTAPEKIMSDEEADEYDFNLNLNTGLTMANNDLVFLGFNPKCKALVVDPKTDALDEYSYEIKSSFI